MLDPIVLVVYVLATARLTGLVTTDTITEDVRDQLIGWLDDRPRTLGNYVATLITCPWCSAVWISAAVVGLAWAHHMNPVVLVPATILAISQAVGMISNVGR